jgi:hypothetical protein
MLCHARFDCSDCSSIEYDLTAALTVVIFNASKEASKIRYDSEANVSYQSESWRLREFNAAPAAKHHV